MPVTVKEYQIAQLYTTMFSSRLETNAETGVEILENKPFKNEHGMAEGQYTHKIYHLGCRLPKIIQTMAPGSALKVEERSWNSFPRCKTIITNQILGGLFEISIESNHLEDDGSTENALNLDEHRLKKRKIVMVDVGNEPVSSDHHDGFDVTRHDPLTYKSSRTGRGPLIGDWMSGMKPLMCAYKVLSIKFAIFGIQSKTESTIEHMEKNLFLKFHKMMFTLMDDWWGMEMSEIRALEEKTKIDLDNKLDDLQLKSRPSRMGKAGGGGSTSTKGSLKSNKSLVRRKSSRLTKIEEISAATKVVKEEMKSVMEYIDCDSNSSMNSKKF